MRDVTRYVHIFVIEIDMAFRGRELFGTFKIDIYANDWFLRVLSPLIPMPFGILPIEISCAGSNCCRCEYIGYPSISCLA